MSMELDYRNKLHEVVGEVKKRLVRVFYWFCSENLKTETLDNLNFGKENYMYQIHTCTVGPVTVYCT